ncbi:DNA polymerase III subunit delta [Synechococcus sp. PCC 7336]|uniref:DNA polymerase III subunit delta n=1 Tax=Synechococcus sp. PCC 7336 TaxID=195250 RepID=UPI0003488D16|nr:DNA polymerase III subunit delta [Synechococcus sp. PCC 7336]
MPAYLYWGGDDFSLKKAVQALQEKVLDPAWMAFNCDRLPPEETTTGLNQAMTPPLGPGDRLVWLEETQLMQQCSDDVFRELERTLEALPESTHLLLTTGNKPDGRLKSTKLLKKVAQVREFQPVAPWDADGLMDAVQGAAREKQIELERQAKELLAEAVGNDRRKLDMELEKLSLFVPVGQRVTAAHVTELVPASAYNAFQLAGQLRQGNVDKSLTILMQLLDRNEPALKILAVLVGQFRTWLWVRVAMDAGERDNKAIAQMAELGNPKRVYFLQKEVRAISSQQLYGAMELLLELEYGLKRGQDERRSLQTACIQICGVCSQP